MRAWSPSQNARADVARLWPSVGRSRRRLGAFQHGGRPSWGGPLLIGTAEITNDSRWMRGDASTTMMSV